METGRRLQVMKAALERSIEPVATNPLVLEAFKTVDRRAFAPRGSRRFAYKDRIIPLGEISSMSEPVLMGSMINYLGLTGSEKVLEIGTASGYGAALLSRCASEVHTIE